jgi:hypothetical protein
MKQRMKRISNNIAPALATVNNHNVETDAANNLSERFLSSCKF